MTGYYKQNTSGTFNKNFANYVLGFSELSEDLVLRYRTNSYSEFINWGHPSKSPMRELNNDL
jgi:hypothetical protein